MELVWHSTAKPRPRTRRSSVSPDEEVCADSFCRRIIPWIPPSHLLDVNDSDVKSDFRREESFQCFDTEAAFQFAKFKLAGHDGTTPSTKRKRTDSIALGAHPKALALPPITNEQIAMRQRRKRLTKAERGAKLLANALPRIKSPAPWPAPGELTWCHEVSIPLNVVRKVEPQASMPLSRKKKELFA